MMGNQDDTIIYNGFKWSTVQKYLEYNTSINKLILKNPIENDIIIDYFLDNNKPLISLDICGDICMGTFNSVISCINGLKELKIRDMDEINCNGLISEIINSKIDSLTLENTRINLGVCHLLLSKKLRELHLIDTFPTYPTNLMSSIGSSNIEKLTIKTSIKHRIPKSIVHLISCIPLFNDNLSDFDFSGVDMSTLNENTIPCILKMKNLKRMCLSNTDLSMKSIESICHGIIDSNLIILELEGIEIGTYSKVLFNSIRLNRSLIQVNLNNSILMANSYEFLAECRLQRSGTKIQTKGCFLDPLIQRLF